MDSLIRKVIKKEFSNMNDMQFQAVCSTQQPLLVLAGAGSGKTTVLINRIANILKYGDAYTTQPELTADEQITATRYLNGELEKMPPLVSIKRAAPAPWEILAVTFTNKAAGEIKSRLENILGETGTQIWSGTFHSICAKILRIDGKSLGYSSHFAIYDSNDQKRVIKECLKNADFATDDIPIKTVINKISLAKSDFIDADEYLLRNGNDNVEYRIARLYKEYSRILEESDAMDFDDLIFNMVKLLKTDKNVREKYQNKFKYIMVDEYQDTSRAQDELIQMLVCNHNNICVVGDDDQSIYSFRGATIDNILEFENKYENTKIIRLEQNYRSTGNILNAANALISNNIGRKGKTLWTANGDGEKITIHTAYTSQDEASFVAKKISEYYKSGGKMSECAVLYRINAQSNAIENTFMRMNIPYKVVGGLKFYDRKEIKDVMSYLAVINNPADTLRLTRIINEPKRKIGNTTIEKAMQISLETGRTLFDIISHADEFSALSRSATKLIDFAEMMQSLIDIADEISVHELFKRMLDLSGYMDALKNSGVDGIDRIENVNELLSNIQIFEQENEQATLSDFLEQVALITDLDSLNQNDDRAVLMTLHSAKGLEFENVFLIGWEEGLFPSGQVFFSGEREVEEERRLAYVGITRAKKKLYITNAKERMLFGKTTKYSESRFIKEIPSDFTNNENSRNNGNFASNRTSARKPSNNISFFSKKPTVEPPKLPDLKVGERIIHRKFGTGMILNISKTGNDAFLEIAFDSCGTKKIMAKFSGIEKI